MTTAQSATRPRRRWLQFSLRTLLVTTLIVGAFCGIFASRLDRGRRQAAAVDVLRQLSASITYEYDRPANQSPVIVPAASTTPNGPKWLRDLLGVDFFNRVVAVSIAPPINRLRAEAAAAAIGNLTELEELSLYEGPKSLFAPSHLDDLLIEAQCCATLTKLSVGLLGRSIDGGLNGELSFSERGVAALAHLSSLRELTLERVNIADQDWDKLTDLQELTALSLAGSNIGDRSLGFVGQLERLRTLNLSGTRISDAGLRQLYPLIALEELDLANTAITDAGLVSIAGLTRLRKLNLRTAGVTVAGLVHLPNQDQLEQLPIGDSRNFGVAARTFRYWRVGPD
jgi:hypothetical protein